MIKPEIVQKACALRSHGYVAGQFGVNERTVRRWLVTGLPLGYGRNPISRETWDLFATTGRTTVDRHMSVPSRRRT